jgi:gas vesicle protein
MKYKSEKQLMKKLDIETWRNLSKDKIVQFAAMMPDMDKEVMFKVIEQFPEFAKFGNGVLESFKESIKQLTESNSKNYEVCLEIIRETQSIIKEQLDKPDIDATERRYLIDNLMKISETVKELDKENKRFLKILSSDNLKTAGMVLLSAVVVLGGKVFLNQVAGDNEDSDDMTDI